MWEVAEHRFVCIDEDPENAGHARHTIFVDDLDALVRDVADRELEAAEQETCSNVVREVIYRDPDDGNEIGSEGAATDTT